MINNISIFPRDYIDTSLSSDTLYSYNVAALDGAGNISLWSATATARTLIASSGSSSSAPSGSARPILFDLNIVPTDTLALLNFKTTPDTSIKISYGKTLGYELGNIVQTDFVNTRSLIIKTRLSTSLGLILCSCNNFFPIVDCKEAN